MCGNGECFFQEVKWQRPTKGHGEGDNQEMNEVHSWGSSTSINKVGLKIRTLLLSLR